MESPALRKLTESVQQIVAGGRIGVPSVVRWYVRTGADEGATASTAERMLIATSTGLGVNPATVRKFGKGDSQVVVHATWAAGAAAVLTATAGPGEPANDLMVMGSSGSIYFGRTPEFPESD
ncbi:MAG: hypothetical protein Q7R41_01680 [Phycisphaerales bacterium]|nr:hypothetical protein [Phycisphaerales bacterium]